MTAASHGGGEGTPLLHRICEVLEGAHGELALDALVREAGKVVPPGIAMRKTEAARVRQGIGRQERVKPTSPDRLIAIGRRALVVKTLRTMPVTRWVDADGVKWVRLDALPPRVARDRARARARLQFDLHEVLEEIAQTQVDIGALLRELTPKQLMQVATALAQDARRRNITFTANQ